jgi:hypothetical protein
MMAHDMALRSAARAIYDACYPVEEWTPIPFEEAERHSSLHYRQAVDAAQQARVMFTANGQQLPLFELA